MTFWQFLTQAAEALWARRTRALATSIGTLTALTTTGIIPESHLKYYLAAITILTYWLGQANADKIAAKVADKLSGAAVPLIQPPETIK